MDYQTVTGVDLTAQGSALASLLLIPARTKAFLIEKTHRGVCIMMTSVMKRCMVVLGVAALMVAIAAPMASAGEAEAGTYGAPFLSIPIGARLLASTDVVVGMSPDASTLFSNPAFLAGVPHSEIFFTTSNWLDELRISSVSVAIPAGRANTFSIGSSFLYSGALQGYDDALNVVSEENYYDLDLTSAFARRFGMGLSLGAGASYIRQHLFPEDGSGYAFNAGASFERSGFMAHAAALNFGGKVSFSDVEYNVDSQQLVGLGKMFSTAWGNVYTGTQVVFSSSMPTRLELGVDYRLVRILSLRAAFKDLSGSQNDNLGLDAGFGVRYRKVALEYAYTPRDYFSSTHTFSIVFAPGANSSTTGYMSDGVGDGGETTSARESAATSSEPAPKTAPITASSPAYVPETVGSAGAAAVGAATVAQPPEATAPAQEVYLVVSGTHGWESSARAEARSYEILGISARVDRVGDKYRVVIGRYEKRKDAVSAINKYKKSGQQFRLVVEAGS